MLIDGGCINLHIWFPFRSSPKTNLSRDCKLAVEGKSLRDLRNVTAGEIESIRNPQGDWAASSRRALHNGARARKFVTSASARVARAISFRMYTPTALINRAKSWRPHQFKHLLMNETDLSRSSRDVFLLSRASHTQSNHDNEIKWTDEIEVRALIMN